MPPLGEEPLDDATTIEDRPDAMLSEAAQITADLAQIEPRYVARATDGPLDRAAGAGDRASDLVLYLTTTL